MGTRALESTFGFLPGASKRLDAARESACSACKLVAGAGGSKQEEGV